MDVGFKTPLIQLFLIHNKPTLNVLKHMPSQGQLEIDKDPFSALHF